LVQQAGHVSTQQNLIFSVSRLSSQRCGIIRTRRFLYIHDLFFWLSVAPSYSFDRGVVIAIPSTVCSSRVKDSLDSATRHAETGVGGQHMVLELCLAQQMYSLLPPSLLPVAGPAFRCYTLCGSGPPARTAIKTPPLPLLQICSGMFVSNPRELTTTPLRSGWDNDVQKKNKKNIQLRKVARFEPATPSE
jgi:hypothetical protein